MDLADAVLNRVERKKREDFARFFHVCDGFLFLAAPWQIVDINDRAYIDGCFSDF